jgi:hypothetical protein
VTEFYSPSKNISCEIDNNVGTSAVTSALCLTISPPKSVTLQADSTLTECTGVNCLSNAGTNTPTLAYGQSITLGPFTCSSSTAGMKCTLANGDGFLISSAATTAGRRFSGFLKQNSESGDSGNQLGCGSLATTSDESPLLWTAGSSRTLTDTGWSVPVEVTTWFRPPALALSRAESARATT